MKNNLIFILLAFACVVSFVSCKKDKEEKPVADFTVSKIANGGVEIAFIGKGSPEWDFGGKGIKVGYGATFKYYYKNNGTYTIKVTAKENSGASAESSQSATISGVPTQLKITYVKLKSFSDTNSNGDPWDSDMSGPDVKFQYYDGDNGYTDLTGTTNNLSHSQLPFSPTLITTKYVPLTTTAFNVYCVDDNNTEAVGGVEMTVINHLPGNSCNCSNSIYPAKISSSSMEFGIEWLP